MPARELEFETKTISATISMSCRLSARQIDKGDAMHPPEWEERISDVEIDIDGDDVSEPLRGMLIEFMKERIK